MWSQSGFTGAMDAGTAREQPLSSAARGRRLWLSARRRWRRSNVREILSRRRLTLRGVAPNSRRILVAAAVAGVGLSLTVVYNSSLAGDAPNLAVATQQLTHAWPPSVVLGVLCGLVMTQFLLVRLAVASRVPQRVGLAILATLLGIIAPALAGRSLGVMDELYEQGPDALPATTTALLACCLAAATAGFLGALRGSVRVASFVAVPLLTLGAAWLVTRTLGAQLTGSGDNRFPEQLEVSAVLGQSVIGCGLSIAGVAFAITLWQAVEATRATRDGAAAGALVFSRQVRSPRHRGHLDPWLLVAGLLVLKLVWIILGVGYLLPTAVGGDLEVWSAIRDDGWLSWLLAAAAAAAMVLWLLRGSPGPRGEGGLVLAIGLVVAGLALPEFAYQALAVGYGVGVGEWAFTSARWVETMQAWAPVAVIAGALAAALRRWVLGHRDAGTVFLFSFAVWGAVRLPVLVTELVRYPWFPWNLSMPSESTYGQQPGWMGNATLDLSVTMVLLVMAGAAVLNRSSVRLVPVVVIGLISTILVYAGLLTDVLLEATTGNAVAFVLPFVYLYLLDAEALNASDEARERRLLGVAALSTLALTVGLLRAYYGDPVADHDVSMASGLLVVPALVTTVVVTLSKRGQAARLSPELSRP